MTLLFIDGFDHYATTDITKKWSAMVGSPTISAGNGRRAGAALRAPGNAYVTKTLAAATSWVIGFAFKFNATAAVPAAICVLLDAGSVQCDLRLNVDGTLSVSRNGSAVTGGTSSLALAAGAYAYIEWKVTIADAIGANSCKVRVNGADWITVASGQDLKATANATATQVRIGNTSVSAVNFDYDDLYVCDQSGAANNDFLGDCRIDTVLPNGDGSYAQFTPSTGTDHSALVDESAPNTTDYVEAGTVSHRDSYTFANLSALTATIYGVQVNAAALKDDAGARSLANFCRSGAVDGDGAAVALSTSQLYYSTIYETDPNTSAAWTEANFNAAEFGVKVAA